MNKDQKKVAIGAVSGGLSMAVLVALFYWLLPTPFGMETTLARLVFTLQMNGIALLPLVATLGAVGNGRFLLKPLIR